MSHTDLPPRIAALVKRFDDIAQTTMREIPLARGDLSVEAVGFALHDGVWTGVLITPWAMNLLRLPNEYHTPTANVGDKHTHTIGSTVFEFMQAFDGVLGGYETCSLESPLTSCTNQIQAREIALAVLTQLSATAANSPMSPSRRGFLTGYGGKT